MQGVKVCDGCSANTCGDLSDDMNTLLAAEDDVARELAAPRRSQIRRFRAGAVAAAALLGSVAVLGCRHYYTAALASSHVAVVDAGGVREEAMTLYLNVTALRLPGDYLRPNEYLLMPGLPPDAEIAVKVKQGQCAMDSVQSGLWLARAGMQLNAATKVCKRELNPSPRDEGSNYIKAACAANAAGVFSSFGYMATYLSMAASDCSKSINLEAICAGKAAGLAAVLAAISVQASFMSANCEHGVDHEDPPPPELRGDAQWQMTRRLQAVNASAPAQLPEFDFASRIPSIVKEVPRMLKEAESMPDDMNTTEIIRLGSQYRDPARIERDAELATCVIDASQAATYLAQMGIQLQAAVAGCPVQKFLNFSPMTDLNLAVCSSTISMVVAGFFNAAAFIMSAVSHCEVGMNMQALCASGALGMVGSIAELVDYVIGITVDCKILPDAIKALERAVTAITVKVSNTYKTWKSLPKVMRILLINQLMGGLPAPVKTGLKDLQRVTATPAPAPAPETRNLTALAKNAATGVAALVGNLRRNVSVNASKADASSVNASLLSTTSSPTPTPTQQADDAEMRSASPDHASLRRDQNGTKKYDGVQTEALVANKTGD